MNVYEFQIECEIHNYFLLIVYIKEIILELFQFHDELRYIFKGISNGDIFDALYIVKIKLT